jgi:hypothetical protein
MKLSSETLDILDNFCSINTQILFRKGNVITSKSTLETVAATAEVPDTFDRDFAIYDLKKLLGVISLFDEPEVDFEEHQVVVSFKNNKQKIRYTYAAPEEITVGPDPSSLPDLGKSFINFSLKADVLKDALKASSVLGSSEIAVVGDGETISIKSFDKKNPTGDTSVVEIGETDKTFTVIFNNHALKVIPADYDVTIHKLPKLSLAKFVSQKVTYYIALDKDSKFS